MRWEIERRELLINQLITWRGPTTWLWFRFSQRSGNRCSPAPSHWKEVKGLLNTEARSAFQKVQPLQSAWSSPSDTPRLSCPLCFPGSIFTKSPGASQASQLMNPRAIYSFILLKNSWFTMLCWFLTYSKDIQCMYIYSFSYSFPLWFMDIEYSYPCHTVRPCCLSILYMPVCIC